jgi:hypothetical protein
MDIDINQHLELIDSVIRFIGRIGFVFLIVSLYKLWVNVTSPLLRSRSWSFIKWFAVALVVTIFLGVIDYIISTPWIRIISMLFNICFTYMLAFYINKQAEKLKRSKGSAEYKQHSQAMDAYIASLKNHT